MKYDTVQDIDYLYASARLRSLERSMLSRERMERMCDAKTTEEAAKLLTECGYGESVPDSPLAVEELLAQARNDLFALVSSIAPDKDIVDVFKIKYDYHNVKTYLKGVHGKGDYASLFIPCGRFPVNTLCDMLRENNFAGLPAIFRNSIEEAKDVLARTEDPQLSDFILDSACYQEMLAVAKQTGSAFLEGYVRLQIDAANLRAVIRAKRMGKGSEFLKNCIIPEGEVSAVRLRSELNPEALESLFATSALSEAAVTGSAVLRGEARLASVDQQC